MLASDKLKGCANRVLRYPKDIDSMQAPHV